MPDNFLMIGKAIKLDINDTPSYLSLEGIIEDIDQDIFTVRINGQYARKQPRAVKCTIWSKEKNRVCLFETIIRYGNENKLFIVAPNKEDMKIEQRRSYIRVPLNKEAHCYLIGVNDVRIKSDKIFPGMIKDISGGGVLLNSSRSIPRGTILVFEIELDNHKLLLTIKVLRKKESRDHGTIDYGCKFIGLDEEDRQKIIGFCNKEQLILERRSRRIV